MAEPPDVTSSYETEKSENKSSENGGAFSSGKEEGRVLKRSREESPDHLEDAEPEEKRSSFKLNPPTLIHGQAKSAPKEEEAQTPKRSFLRPSILSAPPTVVHIVSSTTSEPVNGKTVPSISQTPLLGTGLILPSQVSSNNPFLRTVDEEEKDTRQEFLFQSTIDQKSKENGGDADVGGSDEYTKTNGAKENAFLQMSSQIGSTSAAKGSSTSETTGFIFGSKMEERVVKNEADSMTGTGPSNSGDSTVESQEFLFGKNLSERVKVTSADSSNTLLQKAPAESVIFQDSSLTDGVSSSTVSRKLEEDAAALFAASNTKTVMPEVEVKTGEEDEKNVLQIQCKLYQYDSTNSKNWVERGRGNLRLNDKRLSSADHKFQSRLVMRTNGSLRLILNTKIWATMIVEKASPKSVRISAQNEDAEIGVYLIMATINDAEQIYRAVEYRVLHLKQLQIREEAAKKDGEVNSKEVQADQEASSTESDQTKTKLSTDSSGPQREFEISSSDATSESAGEVTKTVKDEAEDAETSSDKSNTGCDAGITTAEGKDTRTMVVGDNAASVTSNNDSQLQKPESAESNTQN